jgi:zinc transporter ZupT
VWALTAVVAIAAKFAFWDWTHAHWWVAQLLTFALGVWLSLARWSIWRRRHPVLTFEQLMDALRRAAPYN